VIIFIVPKNSGLEICSNYIDKYKSDNSKVVKVRGEDVPVFVERLISNKEIAIGLTGEDLFYEYNLANNSSLELIEKIEWYNPEFIYKKPTLCLLGPKDKSLENILQDPRICINSKYKFISDKYLEVLEKKGYNSEKIYTSGATEEFYSSGLSNLVIDIVCTGSSIKKAGLRVYDKIFSSDIVVIGKVNQKKYNFNLETLYSIIKDRIDSTEESSYTKKLINNPNLLKRKIIEEAGEVITAENKNNLIWECSDLLYFLFVLMAKEKITLEDIYRENERRDKETLLNKKTLVSYTKAGEE
jgi:phosphoribosyl-ATP pyrophosphohydrolase